MTGTLYGVGVGPGDPELVTLKAARILREVPVIAFPKKSQDAAGYAFQIISGLFSQEDKEMLGLVFPMTKNKEVLADHWNMAVEQVWQKLQSGRDVAFVTEGDPLLYSTFIYLMSLMKERAPEVRIEVIPGISSVNGAAARLQLPLADGDDHVAVIPAGNDYEAVKKAIEEHDCVIFIKVAKAKDLILKVLRDLDLIDRARVVTKVTSEEEKIWSIDELEGVQLEYLSLMVVRK